MVERHELDPRMGVAVFTDGSAHSRDRSGGWAWVALDAFEGCMWHSGGKQDTTISQMELYAPAMALGWLYDIHRACEVLILSDSEYVVRGFMDKSRKRNKNLDFWKFLEFEAEKHIRVEFEHVKGHANHEWNELADKLAGEARREES